MRDLECNSDDDDDISDADELEATAEGPLAELWYVLYTLVNKDSHLINKI